LRGRRGGLDRGTSPRVCKSAPLLAAAPGRRRDRFLGRHRADTTWQDRVITKAAQRENLLMDRACHARLRVPVWHACQHVR